MRQFILLRAAVLAVLVAVGGNLSAEEAGPKVEQVIVTFKTHFDIGYTDLAVNVVDRYRTSMIDQALRVCDQSRGLPSERQFVWTIPGWPMAKIAEDWPGQTAERKGRVQEAFKNGRFVVHALPFTTHTELLEAEDCVRGLGFASRLSRGAGLALPRDAKMTDVPCHSWILPTLLHHAGVDFLHLGCNAGSSSPELPRLFWWEGPDGSRLLTMYTADSYGTGLVAPAGWPYKTWLALIHTGDNHGPPTPEEVKKLLEEAKARLPGIKVRIGRLSDFADAILAEKPDLPVVRGDMPDTWIHGPMCDPAGARIARTTRPALVAAESLSSLLWAWGVPAADASAAIAAAYENSLLYGEHTWGGAQYWITHYGKQTNFPYGEAWKKDRADGRFKRLEASWAEHTRYIEKARDLVEPIRTANLQALAEAVKVEGPRVVVYNPLPWKRDGLVSIACPAARPFSAAVSADGQGQVSPLAAIDGRLRFTAREVPPMGYRAYRLIKSEARSSAKAAAPASPGIENRFFKAVLDPQHGTVRSLVDKRSGRDLIDDKAPHGFGQYLYERFDAKQTQGFVRAYGKSNADWVKNEFGKPQLPPAEQVPYRAASPENFTLRIEEDPVATSAVMHATSGACPHGVTTRLVLYAEQPYVDLEITLHGKPADPWPEAGWLCLPLRVERPRFRLGRLGSIVDPACDVVRGSNRRILAINSGLAAIDPQGRGVGLCPIDHPLVSLETPGCWKYDRDFVPRESRVYVNLFNNQWTTNFRMWNEGTWTSRVRLWPLDRYEPEPSLVTPSWEARLPLVAGYAEGKEGRLPLSRAGIEVSRRGVLVTALGRNPDGPGTLLRLWELAGRSGPCEVRLPEGLRPKSVQPIDLRGRPAGAAIPATEGRFAVEVRGFAPASVAIP